MRRFLALTMALFVLLLPGCGFRSRAPQPAPPPLASPSPVAQPAPDAPDLWQVETPRGLTMDQLTAGLQRLMTGGDEPAAKRLAALYAHWQLTAPEGRLLLVEADLDGDSKPETVTTLNVDDGGLTGTGALLVITGQPGSYRVERLAQELPGVWLHGTADLTGDRWPDIIWSSTQVGAHTAHTSVFVTAWRPGGYATLPGDVTMANMQSLAVEGREIVMHGGLIGSVGAGAVQRERTDRYRVQDGALRLTDRRYAPSEWGYHRLLDGITAETVGRLEDALRDYQTALDPAGSAAGAAALDPAGSVPPEEARRFGEAVSAMARFRLGALLIQLGRDPAPVLQAAGGAFSGLPRALLGTPDRTAGCAAAARWAEANPTFLEVLNSPYGYATPQWQPADLCGGLPGGR